MNEVELLVHGREVTVEQHKAVQSRVIWYVPCTCTYMYYMYNVVGKERQNIQPVPSGDI